MKRCNKFYECSKVSVLLDQDIPAHVLNKRLNEVCEECHAMMQAKLLVVTGYRTCMN
jgi:hypothetical protein